MNTARIFLQLLHDSHYRHYALKNSPWAKSGLLPVFANIVYRSTAMPFHLGIIHDAKTDSLEKTLMLGKIEDGRRRG